MSRHFFTELIQDFCKLANIENCTSVIQNGGVRVNGIDFSLIYDEKVAPNILSIYTDFGKLPTKRELDACMALMEANLLLFTTQGPVFAISPKTRRITFAQRHPLDGLTAKELHSRLSELAGKAKEWRENYFFNLKPQPSQSQRNRLHALKIDK